MYFGGKAANTGGLSSLLFLGQKSGPFLMSRALFFLSKEAPREGLGLQWRALLSLKTKEGKPYLILSSQHFDFFHSLFSEQASSEYLGKCL